MDSEVRKRPLFPGLTSYLVKRFYAHAYPALRGMSEVLHALFDWFQPYRNGSCLVPTAHGSSDEYTLYCSCCRPPASSQWKWSDMKAFAVAKAAHERGIRERHRDCPGWREALVAISYKP